MSSVNTLCVLAIFFLASQALMVTSRSVLDHGPSTAPPVESDDDLAPDDHQYEADAEVPALSPEESDEQYKYLEQCAEKMGEECGKLAFDSLFKDSAFEYEKCCGALLSMGQKCHVDMIDFLVNQSDFSQDGPSITAKSDLMWEKCNQRN